MHNRWCRGVACGVVIFMTVYDAIISISCFSHHLPARRSTTDVLDDYFTVMTLYSPTRRIVIAFGDALIHSSRLLKVLAIVWRTDELSRDGEGVDSTT